MLIVVAGCGSEEAEEGIPDAGFATYEVTYSKVLRDDPTFGAYLPRNVSCVYDSTGIKATASAPLGIVVLSIVMGPHGSFITTSFDKAKLLVPLGDLWEAGGSDNAEDGLTVVQSKSRQDIAGYLSTHLTISPKDPDIHGCVDLFFVPFDTESPGRDRWDVEDLRRPAGLITAMNISYDECNVMLLLKDVKRRDSIDRHEFERPRGYIEASKRDIVSVGNLLLN